MLTKTSAVLAVLIASMMSPTDEFANFGIWDWADLNGNPKPKGAVKFEYIREALKEGMRLQDQLGTNPFKLGMAAGTDTHTGLPPGGEEDNFGGKFVQMERGVKDRWNDVFQKHKDGTVQKDWTVLAAGDEGDEAGPPATGRGGHAQWRPPIRSLVRESPGRLQILTSRAPS